VGRVESGRIPALLYGANGLGFYFLVDNDEGGAACPSRQSISDYSDTSDSSRGVGGTSNLAGFRPNSQSMTRLFR
jgi:hypothetical protein